MRRKALLLWLCAALVATCSCNGQVRKGEKAAQAADTLQGDGVELPLPEVPQGLTAPQERAEYIIAHFWDGLDSGDTLRNHNRQFVEQNFVNYLSLFPCVKPEVLPPYIDGLLKRISADSVAFRLFDDVTEHYLNDPNSPMRNEGYYMLFLEGMLRLPGLSETERSRHALLLETARKNRPGGVATDFTYTTREGKKRTLRATRGKKLLLVFYDPACSHCTDIVDGLRESKTLAKLMADNSLTVLAVYTEGDRKLWEETKNAMPRDWIVAIDDSRIVERGLYVLPAMPVLYLLDEHKTVLLKDAPASEVEQYLLEHWPQ